MPSFLLRITSGSSKILFFLGFILLIYSLPPFFYLSSVVLIILYSLFFSIHVRYLPQFYLLYSLQVYLLWVFSHVTSSVRCNHLFFLQSFHPQSSTFPSNSYFRFIFFRLFRLWSNNLNNSALLTVSHPVPALSPNRYAGQLPISGLCVPSLYTPCPFILPLNSLYVSE